MADLHQLNNKQLREKCLEFGLPNVPVTDSSRNVLIKRLEAIMSGKTTTKAQPKKATSPANRRKTVAATIPTTFSSGDEDAVEVTTKRNSAPNRRGTTQFSAPKTSTSAVTRPSNNSYNQHIIPLEIESRASSTKINDYDPRQRRSVSLSKTGVLTTSYSQETLPLRPEYEQDEEDDCMVIEDDEVDDVQMENIPQPQLSYTQNQRSYTQNNNISSSYGNSNFTTHTMPPPVEPSKPRLYPSLVGAGLQTDYYNSLDGIRASHSSTARHSNLGFTYNPPTSYIPPPQPTNINPRQTFGGGLSSSPTQNISSSFLNSTTKRYTSDGITKRHTARSIDDEAGASSSDDQLEAPHFNKFSRNLGTLKPEPVIKRNYIPTASPATSYGNRYSSYSPMAPRARRPTYERDSASFAQLWAIFKEKYHLREALFFITLFIITVFIYVFFIQ